MYTGPILLILLIANILTTWKGLRDPVFFAKWSFEVEQVTLYKRYIKLLSGGFLHADWLSLLFNMIALYSFGRALEGTLGSLGFLFIYLISQLGSYLLALYARRFDGGYTLTGAAGAICGIIFSSITLFPWLDIFFIPAWLFGLICIGFAIFGLRSDSENRAPEAYMGGALSGMAFTLLLRPSSLSENGLVILALALPSLIFIYLMIKRPGMMVFSRRSIRHRQAKVLSIDQRYNLSKKDQQKEIDRILEKVHDKGMDSLTKAEKAMLNDYSSSN